MRCHKGEIRVGLNALTQRKLRPVAHRTSAIEGEIIVAQSELEDCEQDLRE
jgi:hypothetical protein